MSVSPLTPTRVAVIGAGRMRSFHAGSLVRRIQPVRISEVDPS